MNNIGVRPLFWLSRCAMANAIALTTLMPCSAQPLNYEMVVVDDVGNSDDTTGYGGVVYEYQIGKYEVTIGQYVVFLNSIAKTDSYSIFNANQSTDQRIAGIERTGVSGSYAYAAVGPFGPAQVPQATASDRAIAYVSWFDAARFANWMSNGQPIGAQGITTTEDGAYSLNGATSGTAPAVNAINPNTGLEPLFRIPTENEWYKAAYYRSGSANAGYWSYATQSNSAPGNELSGWMMNQANCLAPDYAVTQVSTQSLSQNYLTNVGSFASSASAYGTFDQSGNLFEWNDLDGLPSSAKGLRGGGFGTSPAYMTSANRFTRDAGVRVGSVTYGFRLAGPSVVPEPSAITLLLAGLAFSGYLTLRR